MFCAILVRYCSPCNCSCGFGDEIGEGLGGSSDETVRVLTGFGRATLVLSELSFGMVVSCAARAW